MTMTSRFEGYLTEELDAIRKTGRYKSEKVLDSRQSTQIHVEDGDLINFCSNNYLGFAENPEIIEAVCQGMKVHGFGIASARFICGTHKIHKGLERRIAGFLKMEASILYNTCFDANLGLFESLLGPEDCIISDALNHASIIDGIRLCKAERKVFEHSDMHALEERLKEAADHRTRLIVSDGVFSMDGELAKLPEICELGEKYGALIVIDDSHATGVLGPSGGGTPEYFGIGDRVDIITSTLGKALGGASGGFTAARREIIELLRQRSRPYLFCNALSPATVLGATKALELIEGDPGPIRNLQQNTRYFCSQLSESGFDVMDGGHPIVPIILGDEQLTLEMARQLNERGVFVVGFTHPVVPSGKARIRIQISAIHSHEQLDYAVEQFKEVARDLHFLN